MAPLAGDYLAGYLNGTWEVTEQGGHVRLRPSPIGGGNYGWLVTSCDGTVYRNVITSTQTSSLTQNTWTNKGGSLALSPGVYELQWKANLLDSSNSSEMSGTLSTANNSESDIDLTARVSLYTVGADCSQTRMKRIIVSSLVTYYLNAMCNGVSHTAGFGAGAGFGSIIIEAKRVA